MAPVFRYRNDKSFAEQPDGSIVPQSSSTPIGPSGNYGPAYDEHVSTMNARNAQTDSDMADAAAGKLKDDK